MTDEVSVNVDEAARRLDLSRDTLEALIADGAVRSFKVGRRRLVAVAELSRYVERQTTIQNLAAVPPRAMPEPTVARAETKRQRPTG